MHHYRNILVRMRLGESNRALAKTGLIGRKKAKQVRRLAEKQGWLDNPQPLPDDVVLARVLGRPSPPVQSTSLVLPYQEEVTEWWKQGIDGTTIHHALIRKYGFQGSYSSVRRYLAGLQEAHPQVTTVLEFAPAEAAQVDFGAGPKITDVYTDEPFSTWFFVMTLAWSRHQYVEMVRDQKVATWLGCHRRAFEWFNGVPGKIIIDNPKCAITRACYHDPQVQRAYADCAEGYGFLIAPCPPRDPKKKGRVESGVKFVKRNFLALRTFRDLADANRQLRQWVLGPAGNRTHGTTFEKPLSRFEQTERHLLTPLPDIPPELATWAKVKVHGDCHVQFEKCRYSVPYRLVRRALWLRATETSVRIYHESEMVAVHSRLTQPGKRSTVDAHLPPEALAYKMRDHQWCLQQATAVGPACQRLIEALFAHRVLDNLRAAQGVIGLNKTYGPTRLEAACARALAFDSPRYQTVKAILNNGLDQHPVQETLFDSLAEAYTGQGRFCRDTRKLLTH
jgi:transposase